MLGAQQKSRVRHLLALVLRGCLAIGLLWFVLMQVHWQDYTIRDEAGEIVTSPGILSSLSGVDLGWILTAFAVSVASILVSAVRWRMLLSAQDVRISFMEAIKLQFVGEFFSTVIPGMIGGDLVKAYCVMQKTTKKAHVLVSVFVDRLLGVCGMVFAALVMLLVICAVGHQDAGLIWLSAPSVAVVSAGSCMALAFLLSARLRHFLRLDRLYARLPIAKHIEHAGDALRRYRAQPRRLASAFLISLIAQALNTAFVLLLGVALGLNVTWQHYFLHVPLIMIISAVPITPGGIGLQEQLYLLYFAVAGNPSIVLALAVLVRATTIVGALPGGIFALLGGISTRGIKAEPQ